MQSLCCSSHIKRKHASQQQGTMHPWNDYSAFHAQLRLLFMRVSCTVERLLTWQLTAPLVMQPSGSIGTPIDRGPYAKDAQSSDDWVTELANDCTFSVTFVNTPLSRHVSE